jgi:hypothetical protein
MPIALPGLAKWLLCQAIRQADGNAAKGYAMQTKRIMHPLEMKTPTGWKTSSRTS